MSCPSATWGCKGAVVTVVLYGWFISGPGGDEDQWAWMDSFEKKTTPQQDHHRKSIRIMLFYGFDSPIAEQVSSWASIRPAHDIHRCRRLAVRRPVGSSQKKNQAGQLKTDARKGHACTLIVELKIQPGPGAAPSPQGQATAVRGVGTAESRGRLRSTRSDSVPGRN
jgi:hypothetical protein